MARRDHYEVLGVSKSASEKDVRQAYRRLARKHHPDLNPDDKAAEQRFKEIQTAYDVLSDTDKRAKYDRFGHDFDRAEASTGSRGRSGRSYSHTSGQDVPPDFDLGSVFGNDLYSSIFGPGGRASRRSGATLNIRGEDAESPVEVSLEEAYQGTARVLQIQNPDGSLRTLEVKIPAGVADGSRIRMAGQGGPGIGSGQRGDLFLVVSVRPHAEFERRGDDLSTTVAVSLSTAVLGGEVQVPTPKGTRLALKIPPESQNGQRFRLAGQGMPRLAGGSHGDLYAELKVQLPRELSERERELFRELASLRKE
jgi:DnaJ-class molecular chaperone